MTEAEGHVAGPCRETAQDMASQREALGLRYGWAGVQPAPTTRPLEPRYYRRGAWEGALGRLAARQGVDARQSAGRASGGCDTAAWS